MSRAKAVVEQAAFEALSAAVTSASVFQDAPADAAGWLVILGELKSFGRGGKGTSGDRRVQISIVTIGEAEERAPLLAIQEQIETALDGLSLVTSDGWTLAFGFEEDDAVLDEDGSTYTGVSLFSVIALAP